MHLQMMPVMPLSEDLFRLSSCLPPYLAVLAALQGWHNCLRRPCDCCTGTGVCDNTGHWLNGGCIALTVSKLTEFPQPFCLHLLADAWPSLLPFSEPAPVWLHPYNMVPTTEHSFPIFRFGHPAPSPYSYLPIDTKVIIYSWKEKGTKIAVAISFSLASQMVVRNPQGPAEIGIP